MKVLKIIVFALLTSCQGEVINVCSFYASFGAQGHRYSEFRGSVGIAVDDNRIYVTDRGNNRIQVFNKNAFTFISKFGENGRKEGSFNHPVGIWIDDSKIYISDHENHRIQTPNYKSNLIPCAKGNSSE